MRLASHAAGLSVNTYENVLKASAGNRPPGIPEYRTAVLDGRNKTSTVRRLKTY